MFTASLLAKSGNDFTVSEVINDLSIYNSIVYDFGWWMLPEDEKAFRVKFQS